MVLLVMGQTVGTYGWASQPFADPSKVLSRRFKREEGERVDYQN